MKHNLSLPLIRDVEDKLDQAFSAYSLGMDRASFAGLIGNKKLQLALLAEAMTYFAKSQLYVQMARTVLLKAKTEGR